MSTVMKIRTTNSFIGYHQWPHAPRHRDYLRQTHRHDFQVAVEVQVGHNDREIEFHDFAASVAGLCEAQVRLMSYDQHASISCEMVCTDFLDALMSKYGKNRHYVISVGEDTFSNAAILEYTNDGNVN